MKVYTAIEKFFLDLGHFALDICGHTIRMFDGDTNPHSRYAVSLWKGLPKSLWFAAFFPVHVMGSYRVMILSR